MYAPSSAAGAAAYGYASGGNTQQQQNSFTPNGIPSQHNPHHQQSNGGQPQQHMMFNPQQFAGGAGGPSPYGASQPGMVGPGQNAGAMGMMQNNGMAQGAGHNVSQYQTPYSAAAYGNNMPNANNLPPNFQMNNGMPMTPQQMQHLQNMQRMQAIPPTSSTPTQPVPRASPFAHTNTPPDGTPKQSQFAAPPAQGQTNSGAQAGQNTIVTPQTPNFPPGAQNVGGTGMAAPMSPGSASKEHERVTLLLDINRELLMEVMSLQASQAEAKKEEATSGTATDGTEEEKAEKAEKAKAKASASNREYLECMRRLQANLAYLAAIADKSHKPGAQAPTHPAIITAPPLVSKPASSTTTSTTTTDSEVKKEEGDEKKDLLITEDRVERIETLKSQYKRLQEMFPDVDPKKEGQAAGSGKGAGQVSGGQGQQAAAGQTAGSAVAGGTDINSQQKLQNDQFRQKMMQQAQAQAQARLQAQQQQQQPR